MPLCRVSAENRIQPRSSEECLVEEWFRFIEARLLESVKGTGGALSPPWVAGLIKLEAVWAGAGKDG